MFYICAGWSEKGDYPFGRAGYFPRDCPERGITRDAPKDGKMLFDVQTLGRHVRKLTG